MDDFIEIKQSYLRQNILEKQYNPHQFATFMNDKLSIGEDLSKCSMEQLKTVVSQFIKIKEQQTQNKWKISAIKINQTETQQKSTVTPKLILFKKKIPIVAQHQFCETFHCLPLKDTFEEYKQISCRVFDPQRKSTGGVFGIGATSFLEFKIKTYGPNWTVGRRYSQFNWLRNHLVRVYPNHFVPPIPEKKSSKKSKKDITKRVKILEYFLNDLIKIPQLLNHPTVKGFLSIDNNKEFQELKTKSQSPKIEGNIPSKKTANGYIKVQLTQNKKKYLDELQQFIPFLQRTYKQLTRQSKNVQQLITQQVNVFYQMGNCFSDIHEKMRSMITKLPECQSLKKMNEIYITLNNMVIQWGNIQRSQHALLENNFSIFFKYVRNQLFAFKEVANRENEIEMQFLEMKIGLDKKKQRIYSVHDAKKWELSPTEIGSITQNMVNDKAYALKIMLPKETKQLQRCCTKLGFFFTEFYNNGNYTFERMADKFCENFKQFAIKLKVNAQQLTEMWMQMAANFSGDTHGIIQVKQAPLPSKEQEVQNDDLQD